MLIHASCVAIAERGVLIGGPAGAGKSDLALRLIDEGAELVADDQTELCMEGGALTASAPVSIAGLIEIRHFGLIHLPWTTKACVALYIDLSSLDEKLERMPDDKVIHFFDHPVKRIRLPAFAASTPAKIRAVLLRAFAYGHT